MSLLQRIAAANGTDIDAFLEPRRRSNRSGDGSRSGAYACIEMLLRLVRAYFALPDIRRRRHALRMMEVMAARAKREPRGDAP
ncbi:MAG: hypothetical protein INR70_24375 [Parafilimonas terrae]|nr:hypothetical protein [Parafilimonas terrae]